MAAFHTIASPAWLVKRVSALPRCSTEIWLAATGRLARRTHSRFLGSRGNVPMVDRGASGSMPIRPAPIEPMAAKAVSVIG